MDPNTRSSWTVYVKNSSFWRAYVFIMCVCVSWARNRLSLDPKNRLIKWHCVHHWSCESLVHHSPKILTNISYRWNVKSGSFSLWKCSATVLKTSLSNPGYMGCLVSPPLGPEDDSQTNKKSKAVVKYIHTDFNKQIGNL